VKAWLNPSLQRQGVLQRGLLSGQDETSPIRVNGARLNQEWLSETIRLFDRSEIDDQVLTRMALVAHLIGLDLGVDPVPGQARILNTLRTRFNDAFLRLEDMEAAWVLAQIPPDALSREIRSLVQQTTDRDVLLIYLLVHVRSPEDPALEYALRQGDPIIRHIANQYRLMLQRQAELERTQREGVGMGR
jgi:hypothetical protein